jgi:hypothetical protein
MISIIPSPDQPGFLLSANWHIARWGRTSDTCIASGTHQKRQNVFIRQVLSLGVQSFQTFHWSVLGGMDVQSQLVHCLQLLVALSKASFFDPVLVPAHPQ